MCPYFDVVIVGGGVVGSAIARELARYKLTIAVLEKNLDVCMETSGRNTGVVHGGFAYDAGSLKAKLCVQGNRMMGELSEELGFAFRRCGKVLVGNTEAEYQSLLKTLRQGEQNGVRGLRMVDGKELHALVPSVEGRFALYSPDSGIVDPFGLTIALAENAAANGVRYFLGREVRNIRRADGSWYVEAGGGVCFQARWVINAAGLGAKRISDLLGITGYHVVASKDDYIILDNRLGDLVPMPIYTVPSNTYMGIHVSCTTDGNVLLGPTAETSDNFSYYGTEQKNLDMLYESAMALWPHFTRGDYIRTYSGILPKLVDEEGKIQDFKIEIRDQQAPHAVNLVGIESPGLTASIPIAKMVVEMVKERERLERNPAFIPERKEPKPFRLMTKEEQAEAVRKNPDYGELVCRCQQVSKAEILRAIHNPIGARTMVSVKYRSRAMMGRCQGGYCQMRIARLLEEEAHLKDTELTYERPGSWLFTGKVRGKEQ